ncbi:MAG: hypothetical protein ACRDOC_11800, partial [Streptosporangiaceae bacterium]
MTEDPREFGLSAADLHDAADRLYDPADTRLDPIEWTPEAQARYGRIRSRLRGLADAIGTEPEANPAADHDRPDIAAMRAALDA